MSDVELRKAYSGIYKLAPIRYIKDVNDTPGFPSPTASEHGWFTVSFDQRNNMRPGPKEATYNALGLGSIWTNIAIDCTESTQGSQYGPAGSGLVYPNNPLYSGCGRQYHKPDQDSWRDNLVLAGTPGFITIYPVDPQRSGADWVTYRYEGIGNCISCCYTRLTELTFYEGSDGTGNSLFNIKESAFCPEEGCVGYESNYPHGSEIEGTPTGKCLQDCVTILDDPHYYYIFFHNGWTVG